MANGFIRFLNGIQIIPKTTSTANIEGEVDYDTTDHKLNLYNGSISSPIVTESSTATLTNKTLITPTIATILNGSGTLDINSSGTITVPNATDTLVGRATTDTLTNKTIDAGSNTITGLTNSNLSGSAGITNANLASMSANTIKGSIAGGTPSDLTGTQATTILVNFVGDSGSGGVKGLVPAPASGDAAANKFLKADGTWAFTSGSGVVTIGTIDSQSKSANGAVITGTSLVMQSADATYPGLITSTSQTIAGTKTFTGGIITSAINSSGNLSLTGNPISLQSSSGINIQEIASGTTPANLGYLNLYAKTDDNLYTQNSNAVEVIVGNPPGSIIAYGGASAPSGYILCDGTSYLRTTYPNLFSAIGSNYGSADGTHFNVPDLRGMFLRGVTGASSNDPDAAGRTAQNTGGQTGNNVGSQQADGFASHAHSYSIYQPSTQGAFTSSTSSGVFSTNDAVAANGGNETRPINVYVTYIIKI